jgi:hypothetical protein
LPYCGWPRRSRATGQPDVARERREAAERLLDRTDLPEADQIRARVDALLGSAAEGNRSGGD